MAIIQGKEKFWATLLGGAMATSVTTFGLWGFSPIADVPMPTPDMVVAAITGVIATLFSAALVYLTSNTEPPPDTSIKTTSTVEKTKTVDDTTHPKD